ncbi:MAG: hypothetical protein K8S18_19295, partial [Desulfobacula sp.]|nr:hypothetical protein [Desulfobacula sp.]
PRCRTLNSYNAKYCMTCSMVLSVEMAMEIESTSKQIPDALALLMSDPDMQAIITEKMKEMMETTVE